MSGALSPDFGHADSVITVDIGAIVENWRYLDSLSGPRTETAGVVKANAYGLGAARVAPALAKAGCRTFFVMSLDEAVALRRALTDSGHDDRRILALCGCHAGQQAAFKESRITPVINSLE
ncbi:MAG: alanine racemase, partial [Rhodobiaceae bacterium]